MGLHCALRAWGAGEGLLNDRLADVICSVRAQAFIGLCAGQRVADIEAQNQAMATLRQKISGTEFRRIEEEKRRVLAETETKRIAELAASEMQRLQARAQVAETQTLHLAETAEQQVRQAAEEVWTQAIHEVKQLVGQVEGYAERVAVEANMRVRSEAEYEVVATRRQAELAIERERAVMIQLMDKFEALALAAVEEAMAKAERAKRETRTNLDEYGDCANRNAYDRVEGFREFFRQVACTEQERTARKVQKMKDEFAHKDYFANVFKEERNIQEHNLLVIKAQPKRYRVRSEKAEAEKRLEAAQVAALHDRIQELEAETQVATDGWHEADEAASFTSAQEKGVKLFDEEARKERAALKALEREVSNLKASLHADKAVSEPETCREGDEERFRWQPGEDDGEHIFRGDEDDIEDAFYHPSYTDAKLARLSAETYDQHAEVAREQSVRMVRESETVGAEARAEKEAAMAPIDTETIEEITKKSVREGRTLPDVPPGFVAEAKRKQWAAIATNMQPSGLAKKYLKIGRREFCDEYNNGQRAFVYRYHFIQELGVTRYAGRMGCLLIVKENSALKSRALRQV